MKKVFLADLKAAWSVPDFQCVLYEEENISGATYVAAFSREMTLTEKFVMLQIPA